MKREIFISDYALLCATSSGSEGAQTQSALDAIFENKSGLRKEKNRYIGRVENLRPLPTTLHPYATCQAQLAYSTLFPMSASIQKAREKWGAERVAVLVGTSTGGIAWTESHYPNALQGSAFIKHGFGAIATMIQTQFDLAGPAYTISTACSSSAQIFGSARRLISQNIADAVLLLGVDTLCDLTLQGFEGLGLLSKERCRPFDIERDGINIGEAGGALLLERERLGQRDSFALRGFGSASDGYHITRPPPDGEGAARTMQFALDDAELSPKDVAALNAHGTGTLENDRAESTAIQSIFGTEIPVVSTKGFTGHTLGACGTVDAIISIESLKRQRLPGTIGFKKAEEASKISLDANPVDIAGKFIASNSFAFGGNNVTLIFEKL